jgi:hypothetical protein
MESSKLKVGDRLIMSQVMKIPFKVNAVDFDEVIQEWIYKIGPVKGRGVHLDWIRESDLRGENEK